MRLLPQELAQAAANLVQCLSGSQAQFRISGGLATLLVRMQHGLTGRTTDDIDLVVKPTDTMNAERMSTWLLQTYPDLFIQKSNYGVPVPALVFQRSDGTVKHIEIEIFDIDAWPQRPQYDLDNPDNDGTQINWSGVDIPVFSPRWLLREKIITAFERQGSRKERSDLDDAVTLAELDAVEPNSIDLTSYPSAVQNVIDKRAPVRNILGLKVICPSVLGQPWTWSGTASVYWRLDGSELQYLGDGLRRHKFKWDASNELWYFTAHGNNWYYNNDYADVVLWG